MGKTDFVGLSEFNDVERKIINEYVSKHMKKIDRSMDDYILKINFKKHGDSKKKVDERIKYSLHAKIQHPNIIFSVSEADWDLKLALNRAFEKLNNEIKHKLQPDKKSWIKRWMGKRNREDDV